MRKVTILYFEASDFHAFVPTIIYHNCGKCMIIYIHFLFIQVGIKQYKINID